MVAPEHHSQVMLQLFRISGDIQMDIAPGGLIQDDVDNATTGLPLLSEIPVLGYLFKNTREVTARRELLVMITPRIVRDAREAREVTEELRRRLGKLRPLFERNNPGEAW